MADKNITRQKYSQAKKSEAWSCFTETTWNLDNMT